MAMPAPETENFARAVEVVRAATEQMMAGDSGPWKAMLSSEDDVVLLGAFGGHLSDRAEVDARFDRTAGAYGGGEGDYETIATWVGTDLACTVELERHHGVRLAGSAPTTTAYRVSHLYRREAGGWKVVLRHADPLVDYRGPASVLPQDGAAPARESEHL
jgi:ketosteroid isomerase-like protein